MEQDRGQENGESRNTGQNHEGKVAEQDEASKTCLTYCQNNALKDKELEKQSGDESDTNESPEETEHTEEKKHIGEQICRGEKSKNKEQCKEIKFRPHTSFTTTFKLVTFNVQCGISLNHLEQFLVKQKDIDVICLQELRNKTDHKDRRQRNSVIEHFISNLQKNKRPWTFFARSRMGCSAIISSIPLQEIVKGKFNKTSRKEFVTVKIQGMFLTCLHFESKEEEQRLKNVQKLKEALIDARVWDSKDASGAPHIWVGDFNALTKEDFTSKDWEQQEDKWRRDEVAKEMKKMDFLDCWVEDGRKGKMDTSNK